MPAKGTKLKKIVHKACCRNPRVKYYSSWKDEDGMCINCGKQCREEWVEKRWVKVNKAD